MKTTWPDFWRVQLGPDLSIDLPRLDIGKGFQIYSFDMTGEAEWNRAAAAELQKRLTGYDFYSFVTVQTKSSVWPKPSPEHTRATSNCAKTTRAS